MKYRTPATSDRFDRSDRSDCSNRSDRSIVRLYFILYIRQLVIKSPQMSTYRYHSLKNGLTIRLPSPLAISQNS
jgi:hypothetical protein